MTPFDPTDANPFTSTDTSPAPAREQRPGRSFWWSLAAVEMTQQARHLPADHAARLGLVRAAAWLAMAVEADHDDDADADRARRVLAALDALPPA